MGIKLHTVSKCKSWQLHSPIPYIYSRGWQDQEINDEAKRIQVISWLRSDQPSSKPSIWGFLDDFTLTCIGEKIPEFQADILETDVRERHSNLRV